MDVHYLEKTHDIHTLTTAQEAMIQVSSQRIKLFDGIPCPLCFHMLHSMSDYRRHVGRHQCLTQIKIHQTNTATIQRRILLIQRLRKPVTSTVSKTVVAEDEKLTQPTPGKPLAGAERNRPRDTLGSKIDRVTSDPYRTDTDKSMWICHVCQTTWVVMFAQVPQL